MLALTDFKAKNTSSGVDGLTKRLILKEKEADQKSLAISNQSKLAWKMNHEEKLGDKNKRFAVFSGIHVYRVVQGC